MRKFTFKEIVALFLIISLGATVQSQTIKPSKIRKTIHHDVSPPVRDMKSFIVEDRLMKAEVQKPMKPKRVLPNDDPNYNPIDPVIQDHFHSLRTSSDPTVELDFEGIDRVDIATKYYPPDTHGDVGPNHYVQAVNAEFKIWDKSGNVLVNNLPLISLFDGFDDGQPFEGHNPIDPIILYDEYADRWFFAGFTTSTGPDYYMLIAVSTSPDPTDTWNRYVIEYNDVVPDYEKVGVWHDGYYMTTNNFGSGGYIGAGMTVLDREAMISGDATATAIEFPLGNMYFGFLPADADGVSPPPDNMSHISLALSVRYANTLDIMKTTTDWDVNSNSTVTIDTLRVQPYSNGYYAYQPGSNPLESLSGRLMYRLQYRNFGSYQALVVNHTVENTDTDRLGIRWYELRNSGSEYEIYQQGTLLPDDNTDRWMGSIAMNGNGDIALGYSITNTATIYPSIRFTGQTAGAPDGLGIMDKAETEIVAGTISYIGGGGRDRWGDYSSMTVDPSDDYSFWYTQEYSTDATNWVTRIGHINLETPNCDELITNTTQSTTYCTLQEAIAAANADDNITIGTGTLIESGQIAIDKNLTISGAGKAETILKPDFDTGSSGDARGWWLVSPGVELNLSDLTLDGTGFLIHQAIRTRGSGTIDNVRFTEIKYNESGPDYNGVAVVAFGNGNVDISNCMFDEIGRDGVLYFGAGITGSTFSNNMYTGKGDGDWLDYGVEISAGAVVLVNGSTFSNCTGVASVDGSTSGGVLVSTFFATGTEATISDNLFSNNTTGVIVGSVASDASVANINENNFVGNDFGVTTSNSLVDAKFNYWGTADGPTTPLNDCGTGDAITDNVTFLPFYADETRSTLKTSCSPVLSCEHLTVYLIDSNGDPLAGGLLEYQDGGWNTASEISDGEFCVNTTKTNINLRMTYAEAPLYKTVPTSSPYTFQTVLTTFELRKRTGVLGYNFGVVSYVGFGTEDLGSTGANGLGLLQRELLPREYTFRMKFRGGAGDITQDISVDPVVTWEMARMLVQLNKSDGTRGLNGADIKYKGISLEHFGVTGTSENGRARKDLLPGFYKFTIKYLGGSMVVEDFQVVQGDNELIIDGVATTVELLDSDNANAPLDGGTAKNIGYTSNLMGTTGDSGSGIVTVDLLPLVYSFTMNYDGDSDTKDGIDVTTTPWVTFYTDDLKSANVVAKKDIHLVAFPNPFSGITTIAFSLEETDEVTISIFDINGKLVEIIHNGVLTEGNHKLKWNASNAQKGIYVVRFNSDGEVHHKNIVKM